MVEENKQKNNKEQHLNAWRTIKIPVKLEDLFKNLVIYLCPVLLQHLHNVIVGTFCCHMERSHETTEKRRRLVCAFQHNPLTKLVYLTITIAWFSSIFTRKRKYCIIID